MNILSGLGQRARGLFADTKGPWGTSGGAGNGDEPPPPEDSSGPWGDPPKRLKRPSIASGW
jgi:membrane protease subunit HflK